ncbi:MAG TPA: 50S ribosomal protein L27 [Candidatus Paceibacterota bacterium]
MAHKKAAGSTKNGRDSGPQYLGVKLGAGSVAQIGSVIIRQRGSAILPGKNVKMGRDHTIFSLKEGKVEFSSKRKTHFDGKIMVKKLVSVV